MLKLSGRLAAEPLALTPVVAATLHDDSDIVGRPRAWRRFATIRNIVIFGALVRIAMVPAWFGQDFVVWKIVSRELLRGHNFYAHRPSDLPGGPYAYLPLFAYIEAPFRFIKNLTHTEFIYWGKIPVLVGDALVAWAIVRWCRRLELPQPRVALAVALWWLNPLVLFNGPLYGRFDSLVLGVLLCALLQGPPNLDEPWYRARSMFTFAASIALKTFPAFLLPWFWRNARSRNRFFVGVFAMVAVWSLPFSLMNPGKFIHSTVLYDTGKVPSNLSWQVALVHLFSRDTTRAIGTFILVAFFATLCMLTRLELVEYCAAAFCAFVVFSKIVNEQYLVWAIPFFVLLVASDRGRFHTWMLILYTTVGFVINPLIHPFGVQGEVRTLPVNIVLAGTTVWYLAWQWRTHRAKYQHLNAFDGEYLDEHERELLFAPAPADIVP